MELKNRWALITGASAGFGEATAEKMAQLGCNLILVARRVERLLDLQSKLQSQYDVQVRVVPMDLRELDSVATKLGMIPELRNISILVNNAGLARGVDKLQDGNLQEWREMFETNVLGLLAVSRFCLPHLLAQPESHIVNIGSVAGRWVYPGGAVYSATKFAVAALSEGMRLDLLGKPVRVTNVEPGMAETEFSQVRFDDEARAKAVYQGMTPLTAGDVAETVLWALSRPAHVNISEIVLFPRDQASVRDVHRRS